MQSTVRQPTHTSSGSKSSALHRKTTFPGTPKSIAAARRWVADTLTEWDIHDRSVIELVVSELATNAIVHTTSGRPYGRYSLSVAVSSDQLRVEVRDAGPLPGRSPACVWAHPEATHGRGLALVDTFATWGLLSSGSGVWAEVAR